jgi:hypothetical protein
VVYFRLRLDGRYCTGKGWALTPISVNTVCSRDRRSSSFAARKLRRMFNVGVAAVIVFPFDSFFLSCLLVNGEWLKVSTVLEKPDLSAERCLKYLTRLFHDLPAWTPNLRREFRTQFRTGSELQNRYHVADRLDLYCPPAGIFARHDQHVLIVTNTCSS